MTRVEAENLIDELIQAAYEHDASQGSKKERLRIVRNRMIELLTEKTIDKRLEPDRSGIAKLIDGEAWIAIQDGRDASPDSMWDVRRDWALRKADAILSLYAVSPAVRTTGET